MSFEVRDDEAASPDPGPPPTPPPLPRSPSDPHYWEAQLGEGPATSTILRDRDVAEAIRSGSPLAIHAALRKKLPSVTSPDARTSLMRVLRNRRLFVEPIQSAPGLTTVNGIGARLLGREDANAEDGSFIATLWTTVLFLPLWPIRPYLVRNAKGGGWHFLGRVPLSDGVRRTRWIVPGALAAAGLVIAFLIWQRSVHDDVRFLNGLDFPVSVEMGGRTIPLAPHAQATHEFEAGAYHVVTRDEAGSLVEALDVTVPGGTDVVAYNVLGAAPLCYERIAYAEEGVSEKRRSAHARFVCLAGKPWVTRDDIDYPFQQNPQQVEMKSGEKITSRTRIDVAEGGWSQSVQLLVDAGSLKAAVALSRAIALLQPRSEVAVDAALNVSVLSDGVEGTRAFLDELLAKAPDSIEAHRAYQTFQEQQGSGDALRARYKEAYERDPKSARAAYLYSRVAEVEAREPLLIKAIALSPEERWLRRSIAWHYYQDARYEDAIPHYEKHLELDPNSAGGFAPYLARALTASGRPEKALALIGEILGEAPARRASGGDGLAGGHLWQLIALYQNLLGRVPERQGHPTVKARLAPILGRRADPVMLAQVAALARDERAFATLSAGFAESKDLLWARLTLLARDDPEAAAELARTCPVEALAPLDDPARIAVACELDRQGRKARIDPLLDSLSLHMSNGVSRTHIERLPDLAELPDDLDPLFRAALLYAAARRVEDADRRAELIASARRFDPLAYVVPRTP